MSFWRRIAIRLEEGARGEILYVGIFEKNCIKSESDTNTKSVCDQSNGIGGSAKDEGPEVRLTSQAGPDRRRRDQKTCAEAVRRNLPSEVPQVSSAEDFIGARGDPIGGVVPQNGLRNELSDGKIEKATKKNINVAEVCRWPVSNGEV